MARTTPSAMAPSKSDVARLELAAFESFLGAQWVLRVLDFFAVSMIIPTLPAFLASAGGTAQDYYQVLMATMAVQLVATMVVGMAVDRKADIKAMYIALCSLSVLGAGLYALADALPGLRSPGCILAARLLTGAGTGKSTLVFVVLSRVATQESDRNRWMVSLSTARSLGLFVGPALAVLLARFCSTGEDDRGGSLRGTFALPGIFLCITNLSAMVWLLSAWKPVPPPSGITGESGEPSGLPRVISGSPKSAKTLCSFFRRRHVATTCMLYIFGIGTAQALEYAVPIVATKVLLWGADGSGVVLMAISVVVFLNQMVVMKLQHLKDEAGRSKIDDCFLMTFGICGLASTLLVAALLWRLRLGLGAGVEEAARAHWLLVVAPIVLAEAWFPYLGNGGNMTFTRLVITYVPERMGICQALINTNGPVIGQLLLTAWLSLTYSGADIQEQGAPQFAIAGIGFLNAALALGVIACYDRLRPRIRDRQPQSAAQIVRRQSFGDCALPLGSPDLDTVLADAATSAECDDDDDVDGGAAEPLLAAGR
mmetsp:Transcript_51902/g.168738  ORF Transcript_51902/g.168738 Transcript_51902/m.168738 type:complete len:540 (+) Transcript_51902:104-1723(+)